MIIAIIQAHIDSKRLPEKVLEEIGRYTMLEHVIDKVKYGAKLVDKIVIAASKADGNEAIYKIAEKWQVSCFRGSESDVIDRFYKVAKQHEADTIVRLTSDCPLISPDIIDLCIRIFEVGGYDYFGNPMYPDGLDVEVFSFHALEDAWKWASGEDREHVTPYIINHRGEFRVGYLKDVKLSVDTEEDLEFIKKIMEERNDE